MSTLISITTFRKLPALRVLLDSLIEHSYTEGNKVLICDDGAGEAREVFDEYRKKCKIAYATGELQAGIAINKNRGLKYFFSKTHFQDIILLDDDIIMTKPGMLDHIRLACQDAKLNYLTGYWTDETASKEENIKGVTGNSWYKDFEVKAATELVSWHTGSQGVLMYLQRSAADKVGYFNTTFPNGYGYEHSIYFSRLARAHGTSPELFPVMKYCERWYHGQNIPNNYEVDRDSLFGYYTDPAGNRIEKNVADEQGINTTYIPGKQSEHHNKLLTECYLGYNLYVKEHGLKKSKEVVIE